MRRHDGHFDQQERSQDQEWQSGRLTGGKGSIREDFQSYREAGDFAEFVDRARAGDETARLKAFADLGAKRGFDFYASLGAMNELATDDVVLLNRFELVGKKVRLTTASEGKPDLPDARVPGRP